MGEYKYKTSDASLFLGLMTMPYGKEGKFFEYEIRKGLFCSYKEWLKKNLKKEGGKEETEFNDLFYIPKAYCLFGNFDLAVISLVDDFTFGTQVFRPFSNYMAKYDSQKCEDVGFNTNQKKGVESYLTGKLSKGIGPNNFTFKVINGSVPEFVETSENEHPSYTRDTPFKLVEATKNTFLKEDGNRYNFMGLASFKLNSSLLLGTGMDFFLPVMNYIDKHINGKYKDVLKYIPINSFYWGELTTLFFTQNINKIADVILDLRQMTLKDILEFIKDKSQQLKFLNDTLCVHLLKEKQRIKKEDYENYLTLVLKGKTIEATKKFPFIEGVLSCHVFVNTYSRIGFDLHLLTDDFSENDIVSITKECTEKRGIETTEEPEEIKLDIHWDIKPGHLEEAVRLINKLSVELTSKEFIKTTKCTDEITEKEEGEYKYINLTAGKGDLYTKGVSFFEYLTFCRGLSRMGNVKDNPDRHIRNISTSLHFKRKVEIRTKSFIPSSHPYQFMDMIRENLCFGVEHTALIRKKLFQEGISRIIADRIENMFIQYNDGIHDRVLFGYFLELRGMIESVYERITGEKKNRKNTGEGTVKKQRPNALFYKKKRTGKNPFLLEILKEIEKIRGKRNLEEDFDIVKRDKSEVIEILDKMIRVFESAHKDRFMQSYYISEVTDFNLSFNGGIQQLISCNDIAFKSVEQFLFSKDKSHIPISIAYASGFPGIESSYFGQQINYSHLYTPELYLSAFFHEFTNDLTSWLGEEGKVLEVRKGHNVLSFLEYGKQVEEEKEKQIYMPNRIDDASLYHAYSYFYKDLFSYYIGYGGDIELFIYWHLAHFLQGSKNYPVKEGGIEREFLVRFLMRLFLLIRFVWNPNENNTTLKEYLISFMDKIPIKIQGQWHNLAESYSDELEDFFDTEKVENAGWDILNIYIKFKVENQIENLDNKEIQNSIKKDMKIILGETAEKDFAKDGLSVLDYFNLENLDENWKNNIFLAISLHIDNIPTEKKRNLEIREYAENGDFYFLRNNNTWETAIFSTISLGYIKAIKDLNVKDGEMKWDLELKRQNGEITLPIGNTADYLMDSIEDSFVTSYKKRRKHLQLKTNIMVSLWHYAQKNKRDMACMPYK